MGFDVSGLNPKYNTTVDDFPMLKKWRTVPWLEREEHKDWEKEQELYWKEHDDESESNCGVYFRNNVWWWRPLWQYCYEVCEHLLTEEEWQAGSYNDGHEYDEDVCLEMARLLQAEIDDGSCQKYKDHYQAELDALPNEVCGRCNGNNRGNNKKKDCNPCDGTGERENWSKSYPFDVENVQRFANFLKECGGMCIC